MGIIIAILLVGCIVTIHELGHFLLAKANKIRVDEFSLGLGPTLFGKQIGETKFSLKLLPFGGACMMGEDDVEDMDEGSFNSKSVWARISVIAAGPAFNLLLAWILCVIMAGTAGYTCPTVGDVLEGYPAEEAGLISGDEITKINGKSVHMWEDITLQNMLNMDGEEVTVTYLRDGQEETVTITPEMSEDGYPMLGIQSQGSREKTGVLGAFRYGTYKMQYWMRYTIGCLKMLLTGQVKLTNLMGLLGFTDVAEQTYQTSKAGGATSVFFSMLNLGILLTANLGLMNLLPIPALDGGRLVFLFVEAIRRKRLSPEIESRIHLVGFVALMLLMVFVVCNDIRRML